MRRLVIWLLAALVSIAATVLVFFPAAWLAAGVENRTAGRFTLGDAQGTLWHGSAFIGAAPSASGVVTPLLPGRFSWRLSPLALLGQIDIELDNQAVLSQPMHITGNWRQWQVSPASLTIPAERLAGLGSPLNTIALSGQMRLSWTALTLAREAGKIALDGSMQLALDDIASRLSAVRPLGAYEMVFDWHGQEAQMTLKTTGGPLMLRGTGRLMNGHLQFSGQAEAETGQDEKLANLLNLLGQRRKEGDRNIIALEFN
jgi:general secretion pathway protein N